MAKVAKLRGNSIVFDWGNTLVLDPFDDLKDKVGQVSVGLAKKNFGFDLDKNLFIDAWSESNNNLSFQFASHFSQEEPFIQAGLLGAGVPAEIRALLGPAILLEYRKSFKELLLNSPRKEGVRSTLEGLRLRGKHLAVISNDRRFTPESSLTWLGVVDLFDHFLTSEEIGIEKPDPRIFDVASKRFGQPLSDIIYVGDDPIRDVETAHKAGVKAILYVPPEKYRSNNSWRRNSPSSETPEAIIENFADLLTVIT